MSTDPTGAGGPAASDAASSSDGSSVPDVVLFFLESCDHSK